MPAHSEPPTPNPQKCRACGCTEVKPCVDLETMLTCCRSETDTKGAPVPPDERLCTFCRLGYGVENRSPLGNLVRRAPRAPLGEAAIEQSVVVLNQYADDKEADLKAADPLETAIRRIEEVQGISLGENSVTLYFAKGEELVLEGGDADAFRRLWGMRS